MLSPLNPGSNPIPSQPQHQSPPPLSPCLQDHRFHSALIELRVRCEREVAASFARIEKIDPLNRDAVHFEISALSRTIQDLHSPERAEQFGPGQHESLRSYLSRLENWRESFERLRSVHEGTETASEFLTQEKLGYVVGDGTQIGITPLFLRIRGALRESGESETLRGCAPSHAPVLITFGGGGKAENARTDKHETVHFMLRESPALPTSPLDSLLLSLKEAGYVGKYAERAPEITQAPAGALPIAQLSGDTLLDWLREELAAEGVTGLGERIFETAASPSEAFHLGYDTLSEALDAFSPSGDHAAWLLSFVETHPWALATFGNLVRISWWMLMEASAGYGGVIASYRTTLDTALPKEAHRLLREFSSSICRSFCGIRDAWRIVERAKELEPRYEALLLVLRPSEYPRLPELLFE